ncbi:MAG: hypothetical protein H6Q91_159 [Deltaproteobacteria bacterium]|nr:hypothetical protein [Deltaproteobacteria bacterium]
MEDIRLLVERGIVASRYGRLLGVACDLVEESRVRIRLPYRAEVTTVGDLVHGGAIASLVDIAATGACWASRAVKPASRGSTIGLTIHYLASARGQDLVADARVIQRGSSICFVEVEVLGSDATLVSRATVTYKLSAPR